MANKHETVVEAIATALRGVIAGVDGYVYTPDDVQRVMFFPDDVVPDPTLETVYLLRPGLEQRSLGTDCPVDVELELFLLVARRLSVVSENPSGEEPPERWQIAADLVADACQALYSEFTFGGVARYLGPIFTDYSWFIEGWATAELRFNVRYTTERPGR